MKSKSETSKIIIRKKSLWIGLAALALLALGAVFIWVILPTLDGGIVTVKVQAGKMECQAKIPLLDSTGKPARGIVILSGKNEAMARSPYVDSQLVKAPAGLKYTFLGSFEEVVRVDRATGKETIQAIAGTYRYCFIAADTAVPGTYDVTAQVTFYGGSSEDASPVARIQIPYKVEVLPASK